MGSWRRDFLKSAAGVAAVPVLGSSWSLAQRSAAAPAAAGSIFDVRALGAKGDGKNVDTPAINRAIDAASAAGGGTVRIPAGTYRCFSIRLKSNVALYLEHGATILAASPKDGDGKYDDPEPNQWEQYQDFGHTHWHNSLIWGENLQNIAILGTGLIWGKGLVRGGSQSRTDAQNQALGNEPPDPRAGPFGYPNPRDAVEPGWGNKAIALKRCRNVIIRDVSILHGGHFAILATGVDNLTIDNLKIDTNRDGIDVDGCKNVRISNCFVNSPFDDGICPKSSFALGEARATENVTITNCQVSGYDEGTLLDGTYKRDYRAANGTFTPTGRIKFGTESNGGFKNITVTNCVFDYCRGIALESVDGALLEDVAFTNITMRDISNTPIFMRLGARLRGPRESTRPGALRRVILSNIVSYNAASQLCGLISGIPDHDIEDIKIADVYLEHRGGGTAELAALRPEEFIDKYPEPNMFGPMPAHGFFLRHVKNIEFSNVEIAQGQPDVRAAFVLNDVKGADFFRIKTPRGGSAPVFALNNVAELRTLACRGTKDMFLEQAAQQTL
jgi:polygalacturonase